MKRTELRKYAFAVTFAMSLNNDTPKEAFDNYLNSFHEDYTKANGEFDKKDIAFINDILNGVYGNADKIDAEIASHSKGYTIERISKVALAAMRVCVYEMKFRDDIPVNVSINEALNLVGTYDDEKTKKFVNGILGSISRERGGDAENV